MKIKIILKKYKNELNKYELNCIEQANFTGRR